jgi:cap1 methyltransferase
MQQLILCQFLCGLLVLRPGGMFLCKIFDVTWMNPSSCTALFDGSCVGQVFTPFTAALLHIMYLNFADFALIKPVTSRPANSERQGPQPQPHSRLILSCSPEFRYVVCRGLKTERPAVVDHLFKVSKDCSSLVQLRKGSLFRSIGC